MTIVTTQPWVSNKYPAGYYPHLLQASPLRTSLQTTKGQIRSRSSQSMQTTVNTRKETDRQTDRHGERVVLGSRFQE